MKKCAGILPFRKKGKDAEVFLVHPSGPFWKNKDRNGWSVAKGEFTDEERPFDAAKREFYEETGFTVIGQFLELEPVIQPGAKYFYVWAIEAELDPESIRSNTFKLEWPPRTGKYIDVPEVDKAAWFSLPLAFEKIHKGQIPILKQLSALTENTPHVLGSGDKKTGPDIYFKCRSRVFNKHHLFQITF